MMFEAAFSSAWRNKSPSSGVPYSFTATSGTCRSPNSSAVSFVPSSLPKRMIPGFGERSIQLWIAFLWIVRIWPRNALGMEKIVSMILLSSAQSRAGRLLDCASKSQSNVAHAFYLLEMFHHAPAIDYDPGRAGSRPSLRREISKLFPGGCKNHDAGLLDALICRCGKTNRPINCRNSRGFSRRIVDNHRQFARCQLLRQQQPKRFFHHV